MAFSKVKLAFCLVVLVKLCSAIKEPLVAPYIDVTQLTDDYLTNIHKQTGLSAVTLAFALGGTGGCNPSWAGQSPIDDHKIITSIKNFEKIGGKVIVATGGAMGPYLEAACSSPSSLAAAYKKALNAVNSHHLDIDIEASVGVDNMNAALKILQSEMPSVTVSFTLMIQGDDYGLTDALGVDVLKNAAKHGVNVDIVNAMTMEFGSKHASWGDAVIGAAEATHKQMAAVWKTKSNEELYAMLGVTPMIGRNFNGKVFDVSHAHQLVAWAKQKQIGHLAFWSLGRDNGKCSGGGISPTCSSISQHDLEFAKIFQEYAGTKLPDHFPPKAIPTKPAHHTGKPEKIDCSVEGKHYKHETDCAKYYWCYGGAAHLETCGSGTVWDPVKNICNFPGDANRDDCN